MKKIYKYKIPIQDYVVFGLPEKAKILTVKMQKDDLCLWALAEPNNKYEDVRLRIAGTGHPIQEEIKEYLDKESVERVFGDQYEVTRSMIQKEMLDATKAKEILQEKHLLDGVIYRKEIATIRYKEKKEFNDEKLSA